MRLAVLPLGLAIPMRLTRPTKGGVPLVGDVPPWDELEEVLFGVPGGFECVDLVWERHLRMHVMLVNSE